MAQKAKKGAAKKAGGVKAAAKRAVAKAAQKVKGVAKKAAAARGKPAGKVPAKKAAPEAAPKAASKTARSAPAKKGTAPAKKAGPKKRLRGYAAGNASTLPGPHNTHAGTATVSEPGKPLRRVSARLSGASVDDYIASAPVPHKAVLAEIRQVVMTACPQADVSIKWGQPVFECNGPFAWMKAYPRYVSVGFWRGSELPDPDKALKGSGSRMRHVKITEPQHVPVATLDALVRAAVKLNQQKGDPSKRTGR